MLQESTKQTVSTVSSLKDATNRRGEVHTASNRKLLLIGARGAKAAALKRRHIKEKTNSREKRGRDGSSLQPGAKKRRYPTFILLPLEAMWCSVFPTNGKGIFIQANPSPALSGVIQWYQNINPALITNFSFIYFVKYLFKLLKGCTFPDKVGPNREPTHILTLTHAYAFTREHTTTNWAELCPLILCLAHSWGGHVLQSSLCLTSNHFWGKLHIGRDTTNTLSDGSVSTKSAAFYSSPAPVMCPFMAHKFDPSWFLFAALRQMPLWDEVISFSGQDRLGDQSILWALEKCKC